MSDGARFPAIPSFQRLTARTPNSAASSFLGLVSRLTVILQARMAFSISARPDGGAKCTCTIAPDLTGKEKIGKKCVAIFAVLGGIPPGVVNISFIVRE